MYIRDRVITLLGLLQSIEDWEALRTFDYEGESAKVFLPLDPDIAAIDVLYENLQSRLKLEQLTLLNMVKEEHRQVLLLKFQKVMDIFMARVPWHETEKSELHVMVDSMQFLSNTMQKNLRSTWYNKYRKTGLDDKKRDKLQDEFNQKLKDYERDTCCIIDLLNDRRQNACWAEVEGILNGWSVPVIQFKTVHENCYNEVGEGVVRVMETLHMVQVSLENLKIFLKGNIPKELHFIDKLALKFREDILLLASAEHLYSTFRDNIRDVKEHYYLLPKIEGHTSYFLSLLDSLLYRGNDMQHHGEINEYKTLTTYGVIFTFSQELLQNIIMVIPSLYPSLVEELKLMRAYLDNKLGAGAKAEEGDEYKDAKGEGSKEVYVEESPVAKFYNTYYGKGLDHILRLRLEDAGMNVDVVVLPYCRLGMEDLGASLNDVNEELNSGRKVALPLNINNKHWTGILFIGNDRNLRAVYLDSENQGINTVVEESIVVWFKKEAKKQLSITNGEVEKQKYNNCGPELVENAVHYLGGERLPQDRTVTYHSALYEKALLESSSTGVLLYMAVNNIEDRLLLTNVGVASHSFAEEQSTMFSFLSGINNWLEGYIKKIFIPNKYEKMQGFADKYNIDIKVVDEVTLKMAFYKIALKIHPDKNKDITAGADFEEVKNLYKMSEKDIDLNDIYRPIIKNIEKANLVIRGADAAIDTVRVLHDPTFMNMVKATTDIVQVYTLAVGKIGIATPISIGSAAYQAYEGDYQGAASTLATTAAVSIVYSTVCTTIPALSIPLIIGFTGYAVYNTIKNGYDLYNELCLDQENQPNFTLTNNTDILPFDFS